MRQTRSPFTPILLTIALVSTLMLFVSPLAASVAAADGSASLIMSVRYVSPEYCCGPFGSCDDKCTIDNTATWTINLAEEGVLKDGINCFHTVANITGEAERRAYFETGPPLNLSGYDTFTIAEWDQWRSRSDFRTIHQHVRYSNVPVLDEITIERYFENYTGHPGWPYAVGQTWNYEVYTETTGSGPWREYWTAEVTGTDSIAVPGIAESVPCFIVIHTFDHSTSGWTPGNGTTIIEWWPQCGDPIGPIKQEDRFHYECDPGSAETQTPTSITPSPPTICNDTIPPSVANTSPANNAIDVPTSTTIEATFNEDIIEGDLSNVTISPNPGGVFASLDGNTLTISHNEFASETQYTVSIPEGSVQDTSGNSNIMYQWEFTTGDFQPPGIQSTFPVDGGTNVGINSTVTATFDEDIIAIDLSGIAIVPDPGGISAVLEPSTNTISIAHDDFASQTQYTVTIPAGTVQDSAPNPNLNMLYEWNFTSADIQPPDIQSIKPVNSGTNVGANAIITATFNEDVVEIDLSGVSILPDPGGVSSSLDTNSNAITVSHSEFTADTQYTVSIPAGAVQDTSGNPNTQYQWNFTTASAGLPEVISTVPPDGCLDVAANASIRITFDKNVVAGPYLNDIAILPDPGGISALLDASSNTIIVYHDDFASETQYTVTLPAGAVQTGFGSLNSEHEWSFTSADTQVPEIQSTEPENGAVGVAFNAPIKATFGEDVVVNDLSRITITNTLDVSASLDTETDTITIEHGDFPAGEHTVTIPADTVRDSSGNPNIEYSWSFTVADLPSVAFSASEYSVMENVAYGTATIGVDLSFAPITEVTVEYTVTDGTATGGIDYSVNSGTLTFSAGETTDTFDIPIFNDSQIEPDETINLALGNPIGANPGSPVVAKLTIQDDDLPTATFSSFTYIVSEGESIAHIAVTLSGTPASQVAIDYDASGGSATAGSDYTAVNGTLVFDIGETSKEFEVPIIDDPIVDHANETVNLDLANPDGATLGTPSSATLIIQDNDPEIAPKVTTNPPTDIRESTATLNGYLNDTGTAAEVKVYFEWGPTTSYGNTVNADVLNTNGPFSQTIAGLSEGTLYHYRAKAVGDGTAYGSDRTFTTREIRLSGLSDFTENMPDTSETETAPPPASPIVPAATPVPTVPPYSPAPPVLTPPQATDTPTPEPPIPPEPSTPPTPSSPIPTTVAPSAVPSVPPEPELSPEPITSPIPQERLYTVSITLKTEGGTTVPPPGEYIYKAGTQLSVTAVPHEGHKFAGWSGDLSNTSKTIEITVDTDIMITASFEEANSQPARIPLIIGSVIAGIAILGAISLFWLTRSGILHKKGLSKD